MSHNAQNMLPKNRQVMSAQDLVEIANGALILPGEWHMDPVADIRQAGAVWVHPGPSNATAMSFGFSKRNGIYFVTVRHYDEGDPVTPDGTPYGNLSTAFAVLWSSLMMLRNGRPASDQGGGT
jgi:hypothetical protein